MYACTMNNMLETCYSKERYSENVVRRYLKLPKIE
jgi:hypothetical protein